MKIHSKNKWFTSLWSTNLWTTKIIDTFALTLTKMGIVEEELEKVAETWRRFYISRRRISILRRRKDFLRKRNYPHDILKRLENSLHKFHQLITNWISESFCESSYLHRGFTSFTLIPSSISRVRTPQKSVKLVKLGESAQVSHGDTMNQQVKHRWNLWRLVSHLFYFPHKIAQILSWKSLAKRSFITFWLLMTKANWCPFEALV